MKLFLQGILFFAFASFTPLAHGQFTIWRNTGDTSFETAANWNNGIPTTGLTAFVVPNGIGNSGGAFTVTQGGSGAIVIVASASHTSDGLFITNDAAGNLPTGSVTMTFAPGTTYAISGSVGVRDGEALTFSGDLTVANSVDIGTIGNGSMTLTSGTLDNSTGEMTIGDSTGDLGTFTQSGSATSTVKTSFLELTGGSYTISGTGTNNLTLAANGLVQMGNATFTQNDSASTVDFSAGLDTELGLTSGDVAVYNLQAGTLIIKDTILGVVSGSTATINQSGGNFTASGFFEIGNLGTGNYNLSGGSADFQNGFTVGDAVGSTFTQSGNSTLTSEGAVTLGDVGIGTYNLQGGTATFKAGVVVGATGTINQTGGTIIISAGQTLDLHAVSSSYSLGGTLQLPNTGLIGTGTLSFTGGTLQITSAGGFTDSLNGTVSGNNTLDTTNSDITLSGVLTDGVTGNGSFKIIGGNTVNFNTSDNSGASWGIAIADGTVNADASLFPMSGAIAIASTGLLNLNVPGSNKLTGNLTGAGVFNVNFAGPGDNLELAGGANNFTGTINLNNLNGSGTLQIFKGTWGNIVDINGTGSGLTIGFDPSVTSSGTVTLGNTSYSGATMIDSGFTVYANTFGGSVTNGGTLYALGASGNVTNTGTLGLSQGSLVGTVFSVTGSLSSSDPVAIPVLVVRTNGTIADSYVATTTAHLSGVVKVIGSGNLSNFPIVIAPGGIIIDGNHLVNSAGGLITSPTSTGVLFNATLTPDPFINDGSTTELLLSTTQHSITQASALGLLPPLTYNQTQVANALGSSLMAGTLPFGTQLNEAANANRASIPAILDSLSPESLQYSRMIAFENTTFLVQRMNGVDADLRAGYGGLDTNAISVVTPGFNTGLGRSLGSLLASNDPAFHQAAPNGVNYYPGGDGGTSSSSPSSSPSSTPPWNPSTQVISDNPNPYSATRNPAGPETPGFSEFISGDAVLADLNQNQSTANAPSSKASYTAVDAAAGVSYRMTSHLAAGVLFDYNHTDAKTDSSGSKTDVDSYSPGLFATYFDHGFYANGLFSFGYNNYSNTRNVSFLGETATSHPSGQQYVGDLDVGYDFHPDKNWVVGPTLGVTYTHLDIDSFTETGAPGADLAVDSQSVDSLRSRLGGHVIFQTNVGEILLQPNLTAMWQHEYMDDGSGITSSFSDFGSNPFTIQTAAPSRDSALLGVGLTATLSTSMAFYLNYMADVGASDYFAQSVIGGFKARF